MKPPSEEHDLVRWLDGEMTETERTAFEGRLKADAALAKEARELRALGVGIRAHLPAEMKVPHADFFNSQIEVRIAQMEMEDARRRQSKALPLESLFAWLRKPWLATAATVALAVLAFIWLHQDPGASSQSQILSSYTPNTSIHARAFHDDAAQATVLMLDGLDEMPADRKISGINVHHSQTDPEVAATTLFDATGSRVLMISRDAAGNPLFSTKTPRG